MEATFVLSYSCTYCKSPLYKCGVFLVDVCFKILCQCGGSANSRFRDPIFFILVWIQICYGNFWFTLKTHSFYYLSLQIFFLLFVIYQYVVLYLNFNVTLLRNGLIRVWWKQFGSELSKMIRIHHTCYYCTYILLIINTPLIIYF